MEIGSPRLIRKSRKPQYLAAGIVALGAFSVGNVLGWSSPGLPSLQRSGHFPELTIDHISWIGSIITLGALVGSLLAGVCVRCFGRRNTIAISALPLIAGWAFITFASNFIIAVVFLGRFLSGLGMGFLMIAGPVYLSEISEPHIRGELASSFSVALTAGMVFNYAIGCFLDYKTTAMICVMPPLLLLFAIFALPESPRFFIMRWKIQQTVDAFCWLHGCDKTSPSPEVLKELRELQDGLGENDETAKSWRDKLDSWTSKPVLIVFGIMLFNQLCGGNVFSMYTATIFDSFNGGAGLLNSHLLAVIVSVGKLVSVLIMFCLVDKLGRKVLLVAMFAIMSLSLASLGMMGYFKDYLESVFSSDVLNVISLVCFVLLNSAYAGGPSVLSWTLMSELVPSSIIGFATGATTAFNWVLAFLTTYFFHDVVALIGQQLTFILFSSFALCGACYIKFVVIETKGKSLEDIQRENFANTTATH